MPVVRARQVGTRYHRLGFPRFIGESGRALRFDDGGHCGFAIHFDNRQQFHARTPYLKFADILASYASRQPQPKTHRRAVSPGNFGRTCNRQHALTLHHLRAPLGFDHQRLSRSRLQFELNRVKGTENADVNRCRDGESEHDGLRPRLLRAGTFSIPSYNRGVSRFDALLIVSFGGPEKHEDVIPFLENVLRGRNVPRERMLEVAEHYYHFDGMSPINRQCEELLAELKTEFAEHKVN